MYLIKYKFCHFALLEILFYDFHLIRTGDSPIDYHLAIATMSTEIEWRLETKTTVEEDITQDWYQ